MLKDAFISKCGVYRYSLTRTWDENKPSVLFIGLNPSTADDKVDDQTIRRCVSYSKNWGYGGLVMANLFAYRATNPDDMLSAQNPIGEDNDYWLKELAKNAELIIGAWGNLGEHLDRAKFVIDMIPNLNCLKQNKSGQPTHPLYLSSNLRPIPLSPLRD